MHWWRFAPARLLRGAGACGLPVSAYARTSALTPCLLPFLLRRLQHVHLHTCATDTAASPRCGAHGDQLPHGTLLTTRFWVHACGLVLRTPGRRQKATPARLFSTMPLPTFSGRRGSDSLRHGYPHLISFTTLAHIADGYLTRFSWRRFRAVRRWRRSAWRCGTRAFCCPHRQNTLQRA